MSLLAIYEGNEDRELMQKVFREIADEVFSLTSIVLPETNRTIGIDWFFTGDLKLLKIVCGIRPSNARNRMATRITSRDKRMKLSLIMRWFKEQNILIDQYGTVSGTE